MAEDIRSSGPDHPEGQARLDDYTTIRGKPAALMLEDAVALGEGFGGQGKEKSSCFAGGPVGTRGRRSAVDFMVSGLNPVGWLVVELANLAAAGRPLNSAGSALCNEILQPCGPPPPVPY